MELKPPDLTSFTAPQEARILAQRYGRISPCVREDAPDAHHAWFVVGSQRFALTKYSADDAHDASWHCLQLGHALAKVLEDERKV